ncbi:MAG: NAD(P)/FAD-dependent oxidoreductase [Chloroflexi bacterium]|nr:NAD(P)/FAD-dependent oxidoreductase [Chloroflexota bacterium]
MPVTEYKHDIAIVGAGPAGSATAYFLARGGLDVALIDKATFPRDKTCGDGVSPRALHVLDQMGLLAGLAARSFRVNRLDFYTPNSRLCTASVPRMNGLPGYTLVVPRFILDDEIRKRALSAGAKFYQLDITDSIKDSDRIVGVKGDGATVTAQLTVIATGAATRLLQKTGFLHGKPTLMVAARQYFENLPPVADRLEFYFDHIPLPGYGWLFPTSPTSANIGAGYFGPRANSPRSLLENFYRDHPRVRELIKDARPVGPIKGYPLRVDFPDAAVMVEGGIAVGEAIGLVNPFTGEGIDYALESGQIAAETILAAPDFTLNGLGDYPRRLNARFRNYFVVITRMRNFFYNTFMLNRLFGRGASNKHIRETIMNICFGETDPLQAFSPKMLWELFKP